MIALIPTDFPVPVAPAMSRCGILARSAMTGRPSRSRPSVTGSSRSSPDQRSSSRSSRRSTTRDLGFGTSTPTMSRPGIRATRIERALILRARSSARLTSRFILTPGRRRTPYWVTTGPVVRPATSPSTLNSASVSSSRSCSALSSPSPASIPLVRGASSSSTSHTGPSSFAPGARRGSTFLAGLSRPRESALPSPFTAFPAGSSRPLSTGSSTGCSGASILAADRRLGSAFRADSAAFTSAGECRSSRCSGCHAKVASVSADSARKPTSTAPAGPIPCGISTAKKPGMAPTNRPRSRRLSRSKIVTRPSTPAR